MVVKIKDKEYRIKYSIRMYLMFEGAKGRVFEGGTLTDEIALLLCCIWASDKDARITLDDLIDAIDADPSILSQWRQWLADNVERQASLMSDVGEDDGKKKD